MFRGARFEDHRGARRTFRGHAQPQTDRPLPSVRHEEPSALRLLQSMRRPAEGGAFGEGRGRADQALCRYRPSDQFRLPRNDSAARDSRVPKRTEARNCPATCRATTISMAKPSPPAPHKPVGSVASSQVPAPHLSTSHAPLPHAAPSHAPPVHAASPHAPPSHAPTAQSPKPPSASAAALEQTRIQPAEVPRGSHRPAATGRSAATSTPQQDSFCAGIFES